MELPFTGFELTFIIIAFVIFSLFSLASVCIQAENPGTHSSSAVRQHTQINVSSPDATYCVTVLFQKRSVKQRSRHLTESREWSPSKLDRNHKVKVRDLYLDPMYCRVFSVTWRSHKWLKMNWKLPILFVFWLKDFIMTHSVEFSQ